MPSTLRAVVAVILATVRSGVVKVSLHGRPTTLSLRSMRVLLAIAGADSEWDDDDDEHDADDDDETTPRLTPDGECNSRVGDAHDPRAAQGQAGHAEARRAAPPPLRLGPELGPRLGEYDRVEPTRTLPSLALSGRNRAPRRQSQSACRGFESLLRHQEALQIRAFVVRGRSTAIELGPQLVPGNIPDSGRRSAADAGSDRPRLPPLRRWGRDVWYAKYRLPDGRQVRGRCRAIRGMRPPNSPTGNPSPRRHDGGDVGLPRPSAGELERLHTLVEHPDTRRGVVLVSPTSESSGAPRRG
jgi:hypothetical protein